jgi:hypothetical protein
MTSIVLTLDPLQDGGSVCQVLRAPISLRNPHVASRVDLDDLVAINGPDATRQVGERLIKKIRTNGSVDDVLKYALKSSPGSPSLPICFRVGDPVAHALSWEALWGDRFLALDERWPIGRIARGSDIPDGAQQTFEPPLKLAAVLSAVGRPAIGEWNSLYAAVMKARAHGLDIEVTLFAGEEDLIKPVQALDEPQTEAQPVERTSTQLLDALRAVEPDLVHFYCHGAIDDGVRFLEIGTVLDFDREDGKSSVRLRVDELGVAMAQARAWAVVLNTCRGAEVTDEALTHAEEIVSNQVPVAIGMRRLIDTADAVAFTRAFYPAVFSSIMRAVDSDGIVQWADTLVSARRTLRDIHGANPECDDAWTLPVLYTRTGPFKLIPAAEGKGAETTSAIGANDTVGRLVEVLGDSAPKELLDDVRSLPGYDS